MLINIYTDGSCLGNPGPGGYGIVLFHNGEKKEFSGGEKHTTNNRMEMQAVIQGLKMINGAEGEINLYTDSKYVIDGINQWIKNWKRNGWKTAAKKPVKNVELWQQIDELNSKFTIKWIWVKGHAENEWNNRCDELARNAAAQQ
ncbi:MAG: ribonuclease HI [Nitrospinae bacterium]|nr:ribonuclease HI [Nitrospinota bacterium]